MAWNPNDLTPAQIDRIIKDIKSIPAEPVGPHLTPEEMAAWLMGDPVSPEENARRDAHVASCRGCCIRLDDLFNDFERLFAMMHQGLIAKTEIRSRIMNNLNRESGRVIPFPKKRP